jgi:hypothetical protein
MAKRQGLWIIAALSLAVASAAAQDGFRPLFNGKNLDEWVVDTPGLWRVEDGVIIGTSPGLKYNDFLRTKKEYADFILKATFRMTDTSGRGNSGIQFRTKPIPGSHEVSGYQADMGQQYWGCLYDESRRNKVLAQASEAALAKLRKDDWNDLVVTARGLRITIDLNGIRSVDYTEEDAAVERRGTIALQLHGGPPLEMRFKNLLIRELP